MCPVMRCASARWRSCRGQLPVDGHCVVVRVLLEQGLAAPVHGGAVLDPVITGPVLQIKAALLRDRHVHRAAGILAMAIAWAKAVLRATRGPMTLGPFRMVVSAGNS